ncbi:MAG TPA: hypothetical protein EYP64_05715, partial [Desulfarculaceae bacterium]|nr:hypothetical protein [Desulfarculaceae bacterium]
MISKLYFSTILPFKSFKRSSYHENDKNGILVNTAGYISLPLIGKTKVAGLTQSQAANQITARYKNYLNS